MNKVELLELLKEIEEDKKNNRYLKKVSLAEFIKGVKKQTNDKYNDEDIILDEIDVENVKQELQSIMWENVGILRDKKSLLKLKKYFYDK